MKLSKAAQTELDTIFSAAGGLVLPEDVVAYARDDKTALHRCFTWEDTAAAEKWRLQEARHVIRLAVTVVDAGDSTYTVPLAVSLTTDRKDGGYRAMVDVLDDEEMRLQLLADAKHEMIRFKIKYKHLNEVSKVVAAMEDAVETIEERTKVHATA